MQSHEYRVLPAPRRGIKARGARRAEDRFALAVEAEMNRMAAEGWEFVRSDTLPSERKSGWFSRPATVFETLLVFRRPRTGSAAPRAGAAAMPPPVALAPPGPSAPIGPASHGPASESPAAPAPVPSFLGAFAPAPTVGPDAVPDTASPVFPAPAASRFTPPPGPPRPANIAAPVAMPPQPSLTIVKEAPPADPSPSPDPRRAAD